MLNILLADDDIDDCNLFGEALEELPFNTKLITIGDSEQLLPLLSKKPEALPAILFLDLNMPRKSGFECLVDIRRNPKLITLPVVILSKTYEPLVADLLYINGAQYFMRMSADFKRLKKVINQALTNVVGKGILESTKETFLLTGS